MKPLAIFTLSLLAAVLYVSCEQEYPDPNESFILGNWTVSSFVKGNDDMTDQFGEYTFSCTKNGGMSIQGSGQNYNCNWENLNNSDSIFHFQIMGCGQGSPLYQCIDDWNLISHDSLHCYFISQNPDHHRLMTWDRRD